MGGGSPWLFWAGNLGGTELSGHIHESGQPCEKKVLFFLNSHSLSPKDSEKLCLSLGNKVSR